MLTGYDYWDTNIGIIKMTSLIVSHFSIVGLKLGPVLNGQHCVLLVGHHHVLKDGHPMLQSHDMITSTIKMTLLIVSHFSNLELISRLASSSALSSMAYKLLHMWSSHRLDTMDATILDNTVFCLSVATTTSSRMDILHFNSIPSAMTPAPNRSNTSQPSCLNRLHPVVKVHHLQLEFAAGELALYAS
ncbi:hypothetical protein EDB83DRAFT_2516974 [Lactarius deliciosus]|nr:hypothetical protein EDB83DRAFT_2516974 [Lactarius deliciosus]